MNYPGKTCFVLMPISAQPGYDPDHFSYIYENLIKEACTRTGYVAVRADEVQATNIIVLDIIERILSSDLVICDLSARNPNVMYELGIRHAAQKPVILIKDDLTEKIFDIESIRILKYSNRARRDHLEADIQKLCNVIEETDKSSPRNSPIEVLPLQIKSQLGGVQVFANRPELNRDAGFGDALDRFNQIDIIGLSVEVAAMVFREALNAALRREEFSCRFVIFDPTPATAVHYDSLVRVLGYASADSKRAQAKEVFALANSVKRADPSQRSKMEVKVIRAIPLLYNLWLAKDDSGAAQMGHISVYSYDPQRGGPAFRVVNPTSSLLSSLQEEFEYVWRNIAEPY